MVGVPGVLILTMFFALSWVAAAWAQSCNDAVGATRAQEMVRHCRAVSPSTRPPCNAENACGIIVNEIKRGCKLLVTNKPSLCALPAYH
jgi:3-hydroxymyristoyl/3-hydroxydecanoyl-(acyl carrier protein) dehydratase